MIGILLLAATFNAQLEIQAAGEDEDAAIQAAEVFFQSADEDAPGTVSVDPSPNRQSSASH